MGRIADRDPAFGKGAQQILGFFAGLVEEQINRTGANRQMVRHKSGNQLRRLVNRGNDRPGRCHVQVSSTL
jgi:hypothetical protein